MTPKVKTKTADHIDPRIVRTRKLLIDSFSELLNEQRAIRSISIRSITERAGVNRVTFYAHFSDKYDLLSAWKRDVFRKALFDQLGSDADKKTVGFEEVVDTLLTFMAGYRKYFSIVNKEYEPLFQTALQLELTDIITEILTKQHRSVTDLDVTASFLSWAIFGAAKEWQQSEIPEPQKFFAKRLTALVERSAS